MKRFTTIRTRLLSGLAGSALLQLITLVIGVVGLLSTSNAVREVSMERLPQTAVANQLSFAGERMSDEIGSLITAETQATRQASFAAYEERFASTEELLVSLAEGGASEEQISALEGTFNALASAASDVNKAQERFITNREAQMALRAEASLIRQQMQAAVEDAIDGANDADVETLLRLGLSANLIATLYADTSAAENTEAVAALEESYNEYADETRINIAILGAAATPEVRQLAELFLGAGEGEDGLFAHRRQELSAMQAARFAKLAAANAVSAQTDAMTELVDELSAGAELAARDSLRTAETSSLMLLICAVFSLGLAGWLGYFYVHRQVLTRLSDLRSVMRRVSDGDLTVAAEGVDIEDEIGGMARALEVFRENAIKAEELNKEMLATQEEKLEAERRQRQADEERRAAEMRAEKDRLEAEEKARQDKLAAEERERQFREDAAQREMEAREKQREAEAEALRQRAAEEKRLMEEKAAAEEEARQEREAAAERQRAEEERRRQEKAAAEERERQLREEAAEKERIAEKKRQDAEAEA
ncbi:MAG: HAMP domain-containing protein [Pseudomonadota bacterium]